jgi:RND family efflux transporter, MFP subunit
MSENNKQPESRNWRKTLLPILGLVVVLGAVIMVYTLMSGSPISAANPDTIKTGHPISQNLAGTFDITGVLDSNGKANISSQVSGLVAQVMVKEGSKVKQGDVLASLDKKDIQVQLEQAQIGVQKAQYAADQAKISYDKAEADYERSQQLFQAQAISQSALEQSQQNRDLCKSQYDTALKTGVPTAQETLDQAQLAMNKTDLVSPLDGTVATCTINAGDYINVNTSGPVITIVASDQITLAANVNEKAINWLSPGQKADVQIDKLPGVDLSGEISYIGAESMPTGQLFPVKIALQNPDGQLKPGMTASARVHITKTSPVTVPKTAVFRRNGQNCVFVVKENKAVQTKILVGLQGDEYVAVDQGLTTGDLIVTDGTDAVIDGMTLTNQS